MRRPLLARMVAGLLLTLWAGLLLGGCANPAPSPSVTTAAPAGPRITDTVQLGARTVELTVDSPAVGSSIGVRLLLPTRYAAEPNQRFPVLYLLHGATGTDADWTDNTDIADLTKDADVIVAMPYGGAVGFYSDWIKGPAWETFHTKELPALLVSSYRSNGKAVVAGLSMGGLGAMAYAARHPGMFGAAASFSGVVHTRLSSGMEYIYDDLVSGLGGNMADLWGDQDTDAATWQAHNPYDLAPQMKGVPLFVSFGDGNPGPLDVATRIADANENTINLQNVAFVKHLADLGVQATVEAYGPGTHSWPYWQRELHRAWPMLATGMGIAAS